MLAARQRRRKSIQSRQSVKRVTDQDSDDLGPDGAAKHSDDDAHARCFADVVIGRTARRRLTDGKGDAEAEFSQSLA